MAATFYAQRLAAYRWQDIADAIANVIAIVREWYEEEGGNLASSPTDGWEVKHKGILASASYDEGENAIVASVYLGQTFRDSPSGSFYAPWSAVPVALYEKDLSWSLAFERAASKYGLSLVSGEGDPTDTYAMVYADVIDPADLALMPDDIGAK